MILTALPETVRGLPLHPLVVHAVVVFVPLAAFGTMVCAVWPAVRRHFGALVLAGTVVATALVPIATGSGKDFERRLGAEELVRSHQRWAERMLPSMIAVLLSILVIVVLDIAKRTSASSATASSPTGSPARTAPANDPADTTEAAGGTGGGFGSTMTATRTRPTAARLTEVDRRVGALIPPQLHAVASNLWLRRLEVVVAVIGVVAALVALYVCFQTGESGARAVWGGR
jgi:hypothetical protein